MATALPRYDDGRERGTLAMAVAERLRELILTEYTEGALIGSEDDLVERFGVSRPTLRQAIRMLQADGLVTVRRGNSGGFFASTPTVETVARSASLLLRHEQATVDHVVAVARLTVPEMAALAAAHPDVDVRGGLVEFVRASWSAVDDLAEATRLAGEFGTELGLLSRNPALALFAAVMSQLVDAKADSVPDAIDPEVTQRFMRTLRATHEAIADAVRVGDVEGARAAAARLPGVHVRFVADLHAHAS